MKIKVYYKKISFGYIELDSKQQDIDKAIIETTAKVLLSILISNIYIVTYTLNKVFVGLKINVPHTAPK